MSLASPSHHAVRGPRIREEEHPVWIQSFQSDLRDAQLNDDRHAWTAVAGTLLMIVSVGVTLAIISVVLCV